MAPIKEPNYFSYGYAGIPFAGPGRERLYASAITDRRTYEAMFEGAGDALAVGEASINYMLHPEACAGIRALTPDARLLFVLRQPVERAWSSFQRSRHEGTEKEPDFLAAWRDDGRRRDAGHWSSIHRYKSLYGRHLKVWFETFPREQIKVLLFDDILADSAAVMRDVYGFLGVDPGFVPNTSVVYNRSGEIANPFLRWLWFGTGGLRSVLVPLMPVKWRGRIFPFIARNQRVNRSRVKIDPALRSELTEELRDDILALQDLIGRDLSGWFAPR
jgi:hypothetical protein